MADALTPNLGLTKPDVGASDDTWGEKLNGNFDILDTAFGGSTIATKDYVDAQDNLRVLKAGDKMTGNLEIEKDIPRLTLDKTGLSGPVIVGQNLGQDRWTVVLANGIAEGGNNSNTGSNFSINRHNDDGSFNGMALEIKRNTGEVLVLADPVSNLGVATKIYVDNQNLLKANIASPVFTGNPQAPTPTAGDNDTSIATTAFVASALASAGASPSNVNPIMDGVAAPGVSTAYSRGDHVHPTDTSRAPLDSPVFTGDARAPDPPFGDNDNSIATTKFVQDKIIQAGGFTIEDAQDAVGIILTDTATIDFTYNDATPSITASVKPGSIDLTSLVTGVLPIANGGNATTTGISAATQTALNLKADLASPTFTGDPKAPTPTAGDNDTSIATTAFVTAANSLKANLASPVFTGDPQAPTPATADNDTSIATTAFVKAQGYATSASVPSPSGANPLMNGTAAPGSSAAYSRGDHVHPSDTSRVAKIGDTMTGSLTISLANPSLILNKSTVGEHNQIVGNVAGNIRWLISIGNPSPESGGNAGSDFTIYRYSGNAGGAGAFVGPALNINRANGRVELSAGDPINALDAATKQYVDGVFRYTQYTSGSGTHTVLAGTKRMRVITIGGGAGGSGSGTSAVGSGTAGATTFGGMTSNGGVNNAGGAASGGDINISGGDGSYGNVAGGGQPGGNGGSNPLGMGGVGVAFGNHGGTGKGYGSGGAGGSSSTAQTCGSGGGAGGYCEKWISSPAASYNYTVGALTSGTATTTTGGWGGGGTGGLVAVWEFL